MQVRALGSVRPGVNFISLLLQGCQHALHTRYRHTTHTRYRHTTHTRYTHTTHTLHTHTSHTAMHVNFLVPSLAERRNSSEILPGLFKCKLLVRKIPTFIFHVKAIFLG